MVFVDFLKVLNLDPCIFNPFAVFSPGINQEVVIVTDQAGCDDQTQSKLGFDDKRYIESTVYIVRDSFDPDTGEQLDAPIEKRVVKTLRSCLQCDHCQSDEDFVNGSDGHLCGYDRSPITDIWESATTCDYFLLSDCGDQIPSDSSYA